MSEILLKTIVEKADAQEKKIIEMQEVLKDVSRQAEEVNQIGKEVGELKNSSRNISFPIKQMQELSNRLAETAILLKQPVTNKVVHHHYIPKITWIAAGLFVALVLVCSGWYMTAGKLDEYEASDTKYRYLKLSNKAFLQQVLFTTDSLYRLDKGLRDSVAHREEVLRQRFELQQLVLEKEKEVNTLKEKLK